MNTQQRGIITLVHSALTGEKYLLPDDFDLNDAYSIAHMHQVSSLLYYGALNCGISEELPVMQRLFLDTCRIISKSEQQLYEIDKLFRLFDENRIDYMPIKGTLIKKMYPKPEMRTMGDSDTLIRTEQYNKIKHIMANLGYKEILESDHELVWDKHGIHIELHKRLIPSYNKDYYAYYGDGWRLGRIKNPDSTRYELTDEDHLIYIFTHFAKHYRDAGIGIKHIIDLWVYRHSKPNLNNDYILEELKKLELADFYINVMRTVDVWFEDANPDDITDFITQFIFTSGVYGTYEARILSSAVKATKSTGTAKKARSKKVLELVFLPYRHMCQRYPILNKAPLLLPIMWLVRWFDVIIFKRDNIKQHNADLKIMSENKIDSYQQALNYVGLDFNFKE